MTDSYPLAISKMWREPNDMLCLQLQPEPDHQNDFEFLPGQYLTLGATVGGQRINRSYSLCSSPGEPLTVAIKNIEGGIFSSHAHERLQEGDVLRSLAPAGEFVAPCQSVGQQHLLCIAAGSGITPILSIVRASLKANPVCRVTLMYGNRKGTDIAFMESLCWLKNAFMERFQWINVLSQERQIAPALHGRINNETGAALNGTLINIEEYDDFFLCGPEGLIAEVSRGLRALGIEESRIHYELFFASAEDARLAIEKHKQRARDYGGMTTQVTVRAGGREVSFGLDADGESILDSAMNNGLNLPFSCKGGVCATCKAKVLSGEVDMDLNHGLSEGEVEAGYVLTCQAHPISKNVSIDYDVT